MSDDLFFESRCEYGDSALNFVSPTKRERMPKIQQGGDGRSI